MPNQLVEAYRQQLAAQGKYDPTPDHELTLRFGQLAEQQNRGAFDQFPDFAHEYSALREANAPSLIGEAGNAIVEGTKSLGATMLGGAAALTGSDYLADKARELEEPNPDRQATIQSLEDINPGATGISKYLSKDALRYAVGKTAGSIPSLAEGVVTSAIGGAAGSAFGPEGTVAGAAEGAVEGLVGRGLIKSAIKKLIAGQGENLVKRGLIKEATEDAVTAAMEGGSSDLTKVVLQQARSIAQRRGSDVANALNAYVQSAGMIQNETGDRELALTYGGLSAVPNTVLPHMVMKRLFPDVSLEVATENTKSYIARTAMKALETGGIGAGAGTFQEAVNIVAKNLKEGKRPLDFQEGDWKRLREAGIAGGLGGALLAPIAAIHPTTEADLAALKEDAASPVAERAVPSETTRAEVPIVEGPSSSPKDALVPRLTELGYTPEDIQAMAPLDAQEIVADARIKPSASTVETNPVAESPVETNAPPVEEQAIEAPEAAASTPEPTPETQPTGPAVRYTYAHQPEEVLPDGQRIPGYTQIDEIRGDENTRSSNLQQLRSEGINLPDVPSWLPRGNYTEEEIHKAIADGPPAGSEAKLQTEGITPEPAPLPEPKPGTPIPAQVTTEIKPFTFGTLTEGQSVDLRSDERLAKLPPDQLIGGLSKIISGVFNKEGNRSKTRVALALEAPDGHVVKAGLIRHQSILGVDGKRLTNELAVQGMSENLREGNRVTKAIAENGTQPASLKDVINAGYKPIYYLKFDAEPGKIYQSFPNEKSFSESLRASDKTQVKERRLPEGVSAIEGQRAYYQEKQLRAVEARIDEIGRAFEKAAPDERESLMAEYQALAARQDELFRRNQTTPGTDELTPKYRTQLETAADSSNRASELSHGIKRLGNLGVKVDVFVRNFLKVEKPGAVGVEYSPWHIALGIDDVASANTGNLVTLLHEGVHSMVDRLGLQNPKLKAKVLSAATNLFTELRAKAESAADQNGIDVAHMVDAEDAMAEAFAQRLARDGIQESPSIAKAVVRWVKDLYYRTAMAIQAGFGVEPSDKLAMDWVENQFRREMGGDFDYSLTNLMERFMPSRLVDTASTLELQRGTPGLVTDFVDPVTFARRQPQADLSTVEGLEWNRKYQQHGAPDEGHGFDETDARRNSAAINHELDVMKRLHEESKTSLPWEAFFRLAGRGDLPEERLANEEKTFQGASSSKLGDGSLSEEQNRYAQIEARVLLEKNQMKAAKAAAVREETVRKLSEQLVEQSQQASVAEQNLRDAEMHTRIFRDMFKNMVKDTIAGINRGMDLSAAGASFGEAIREAAELGERENLPENFRNFLKTAQWENVNLFNYLDSVAKLDLDLANMSVRSIIKEIRSHAADNPTLQALKENKPLLAAITALARDNAGQMDLIQLGRTRNTEMFLRVTGELNKIRQANESQLRAMLDMSDREAKVKGVEQRVKQRALERRQEIRRTQNQLRRATIEAEVLRKVQIGLEEPIKQLQAATGAYQEFTIVKGAKWTAMQFQPDGTWKAETRTLDFNPDGTGKDAAQVAHDLVQNRRWLEIHKDEAGTAAYERIARATYELGIHDFQRKYEPEYRGFMDRMLQPIGEGLRSLGGAGARANEMMIQWQAIVKKNWGPLHAQAKWWTKSFTNLEEAVGITDHKLFDRQIYTPLMFMLGQEPGLDEGQAIRKAVKFVRARVNGQVKENFTEAVGEFVRRTKQVNDRMVAIAEENDMFIDDPRLRSGFRRAVQQGFITTMRKLNGGTVERLTKEMMGAGWKLEYHVDTKPNGEEVSQVVRATTFDGLTPETAADPQKLREMVQPLFTKTIVREWLEPFLNKPGEQLFKWNGKRISQLDVQHAWTDSAGDVVGFIDNLARTIKLEPKEEGTDPLPAFRVSMLRRIDQLFGMEAKLAHEAKQPRNLFDAQGRRPHALMDARQNNLIPPEHLEHQMFDDQSVRQLLGVVAFHGAFGRNGEKMVRTMNELKSSLQGKKAQFEEVQRRAGTKGGRVMAAADIGADYRDLAKASKRYADAVDLEGKLRHLFGFNNPAGPLGDARPALAILSFMTGQVVNNPKTALFNLVSLAARPVVQRSLSADTIGATFNAYKETAKLVFGGALNAMHMNVLHASEYARDVGEVEGTNFQNLPYGVALVNIGKGGNNQGTFSDRWVLRPLERISSFQKKGLTGSGESEFPRVNAVPGIGGVMSYVSQVAGIGNALGNIRQFELLIKKGIKYYQQNPEALNDPTHRFSAKDLGMADRGFFGSEGVFDYYKRRANDYRIGNIEDIAREAMQRQANGERLLSRDQALAAALMSANELNLEASVNTRVGALSDNPILKYGMPLLGWPLQQMNQINQMLKTVDGQRSAIAALKTVGRLAMWSLPMGVAFSLAMDQYDEKLLGKKSNVGPVDWQTAVPIVGIPLALATGKLSARQNFLGMLERQAKAGNVYGLGGDLAAQIFSPQLDPQAGQRAFSLDSRVLAFSQFSTLIQSISNFINQDGTVTWASVGAPTFRAMGGNGVLHAVDLLNNALGLDNSESRMVARMNAQAWLRSAARETGVELQGVGSGGTSSPTPLTPWVREMQLAAFAHDRFDFQQAYQRALNAAREMGAPDAEARVLESWRARNPLSVFHGKPTPSQMQQMFSIMSDEGRESVQSAINSYNEFSQIIAPTPAEKYFKRQMRAQRAPSPDSLRRQLANVFQ